MKNCPRKLGAADWIAIATAIALLAGIVWGPPTGFYVACGELWAANVAILIDIKRSN